MLKLFTILAIFGLALAQAPAPSTELPEKIPGTTAGLSGGWSRVKDINDIKRLIDGSVQAAVNVDIFDDAEEAVTQCAFTQVVAGTNAVIVLASADGQAASVSAFLPLPGQNSPDTYNVEEITPADANAICTEGPTSSSLPPTLSASAPGGWTKLFASDPEVKAAIAKINAQSGTDIISSDDTILCVSSQIVNGKQWFFSVDSNNPNYGSNAILVWVVEPATGGDSEITTETVYKDEAQEACTSATPPPKAGPPLVGGAPTVSPDVADAESIGEAAVADVVDALPTGAGVRSAAMVVAPLVVVASMLF